MSQTSWTESLKVKDLTEQIGQGFGILDSTGTIQYVNRQLAQILGYQPEDLVGTPFESIQEMGTGFEVKPGFADAKNIIFRSSNGTRIPGKITMKSLESTDPGWYVLVSPVGKHESIMTPDFMTALDYAAPRMMIVGSDFKIQYANLALTNRTSVDMVGISALLGVQKPYREGLQNVIEAVFEEGVIGSIEMSESYPDRPTRWFVLRISPIKVNDDVVSVVISSTNITDRVVTTKALRESEERFRGIFENANDSMILTDENGYITTVNSAYEKLFGVERTNLVGKPVWEAQTALMIGTKKNPEYQKEVEEALKSFFEKGDASWIDTTTKGEFIHQETGEQVWFEQHSFKIPTSNGSMLCSFAWDITERTRNEEARKRSEKMYSALFEQVHDAILLLNLEGKHIAVNQRASELLGYSNEELLEIGFKEIIAEREFDEGSNRFSDLLKGKILPIYERTIRKKNGDEVVVDINVSLVRDDNGEPLHIQSIMRDITQKKRNVETLRESEERLDLALQGADLGVWDWDTDKNELKFNERYAGILGFEPEDIGTNYNKWETLVHPEDLLIMEERWNAHVDGNTPFYSSEHRMRTRSGDYKWILERGKVIEHNEEGGTKRASGTILDITERVLAEQALREEEIKYRTIVEHSLIGIAILPPGPVSIIFANSGFANMLGYTVNEVLAMNTDDITNLIHIDDREVLRDYLRSALQEKSRDDFIETRLGTKEGSQLWIELSAGKIDYRGSPALQVTLIDISKRREMEEGLRMSEAKGRTLLQSLNDLVIVYDEDDNHTEVFTGNEELVYTSPNAIIGRHISEVLPEEVSSRYLTSIQRVRETGKGETIDYSLPINDDPRHFSANVSLHEDRKSVVVVIRDTTARHAAEVTLRRDRRIFHQLAQSFIQVKDINEVTDIILNELASAYDFDFGLFAQFDSSSNTLQRTASFGTFAESIPPQVDLSKEDAESFLIAHVFKSKIALFISDIEREVSEKSYLSRIRRIGAKSAMAAPVLDEAGNVLAVYSFATNSVRSFDASDFDIFSTITNMLGTVLERRNAELQKQKAQEALERERKAFQSIANAVLHTSDTGDLATKIMEGLIEALGFDFGTLRLYNEEEKVLKPTAMVGIDISKLTPDVPCCTDETPQHLVSLVGLSKEKIIAPDVYKHASTSQFKARFEAINVKSVVVWPILNENDVMIGVMSIGSYTPIDISETTRPFFDALAGMLNTLFERRKTEQALKISKRRYQELITDVSEGIGMADLDERIFFVNDVFAEILGYRPDELIGMSILDLVDPEDMQEIIRQTGIRKEGETSRYTHRFIRKDGERCTVRVSAVPSRNDEGEIDGTVAIVTDITEQLKAESALKESEVRFRSIFERSPVGMHLAEVSEDGHLILVDANPASAEFDKKYHSIKHFDIGSQLNYEISGLRGKVVEEKYKKILATGVPWNLDDDIVDKQGRIVGAVQLQIFRVSSKNVVTSFLDISQRVIAERQIRELNQELAQRVEERTAELAAANKELEAFAYSVSHDLRAPLRTMDGFSKALLEDYFETVDETGQDYLQRIRAAATRMGSLIEDVLSLSRVTRSEMDRTTVNLSDLAREAMQEITDLESNRQIVFSTNEVANARCDRRLMKIAIRNLLDNAWKFSEKVEDTKIEFGTTEQDGKIVFFVKDNGSGFEMKHKEKLFTPFQRLHPSEEFEGSGIGLATVQRVINRHGGLIWAESVVDEGSTFYFTIPD
ncbi:MAG: PAS domain S-box protein [Candidatus Thorarchaeota archaeon]